MSQDSEYLVRAALAAWNSGGSAAFLAYTSYGIVLDDPPEQPDRGQWIGRDAVSKRLDEMSATTGGRWVDIEDVRAIGDRLLVLLDWRSGNSSHAQLLASIYLLIETDDSQISSVRVFLEERAAIDAALERSRAGRGGDGDA